MSAADPVLEFEAAGAHSCGTSQKILCIDLDECIANRKMHQAEEWLNEAKQSNRRVVIVGSSESLREADSLRETGAFFMRRKSLAPAFRESHGEELIKAVTDLFVQSYEPFEKTASGYVNRTRTLPSIQRSPPLTPLGRAESTYSQPIMSPEQKAQFRAWLVAANP